MLRVSSPLAAEDEATITKVLDCAFAVHRARGPGFKERIYEIAFCLELDSRNVSFECERPVSVGYREWTIPGQRDRPDCREACRCRDQGGGKTTAAPSTTVGVLPADARSEGGDPVEFQHQLHQAWPSSSRPVDRLC